METKIRFLRLIWVPAACGGSIAGIYWKWNSRSVKFILFEFSITEWVLKLWRSSPGWWVLQADFELEKSNFEMKSCSIWNLIYFLNKKDCWAWNLVKRGWDTRKYAHLMLVIRKMLTFIMCHICSYALKQSTFQTYMYNVVFYFSTYHCPCD